jgi:hypothetical protein
MITVHNPFCELNFSKLEEGVLLFEDGVLVLRPQPFCP